MDRSKIEIKDEYIVKKSKKGLVLSIIAVIVIALCAFVVFNHFMADNKIYTAADVYLENLKPDENKVLSEDEYTEMYNNIGYANVSGMTIGEWCAKEQMGFERFVDQFKLPKNITEDTYHDVAVYMMPIIVRAEIENTDFATMKEKFAIPDVIEIEVTSNKFIDKCKALFLGPQFVTKQIEVNESTPWGLIYDDLPIESVVKEEDFAEFKENYNFGEDITPQTKMRDVRAEMEEVQIEERQKKANTEKTTETVVVDNTAEVTKEPEENTTENATEPAGEVKENTTDNIAEPAEEEAQVQQPETVEQAEVTSGETVAE